MNHDITKDEHLSIQRAIRYARARRWDTGLEIDDMRQEASIRVWQSREQTNDYECASKRNYFLALYAILDHRRVMFGRYGGKVMAEASSFQPAIDLDTPYKLLAVKRAVASLEGTHAEVAAKLLDGQSNDEIAESFNVTSSRISQLKREIEKKLDKHM